MLLTPGDCIDRYELLYPVAHGGMGSIWAARLRSMRKFERLFAVKVMLPQFAGDPDLRAMLIDEARIAAGIVHPNVAQVIDVGEHAGGVYLVMEWIDGDSVQLLQRSVLSEGERIPPGLSLRIVADTCAGLHAAHELRDADGELLEVVHRDVSPHNILVGASGAVKLIDFGIAKARGRVQDETSLGVVKGKLRYMAPEQFSNGPIDRRADIWSMGAVLHYLVVGEHLYAEESEAATVAAVANNRRRALPPWVLPPIAAVLSRALEPEPAARFATAHEMADAIEAAADDLRIRSSSSQLGAYYSARMGDCIDARRQALLLGASASERLAELRANLESGSRRRAAGPRLVSSPPDDGAAVATDEDATTRAGADTRALRAAVAWPTRRRALMAGAAFAGAALVGVAVLVATAWPPRAEEGSAQSTRVSPATAASSRDTASSLARTPSPAPLSEAPPELAVPSLASSIPRDVVTLSTAGTATASSRPPTRPRVFRPAPAPPLAHAAEPDIESSAIDTRK